MMELSTLLLPAFDREGRVKKAEKTLSILKDYSGSLKKFTLLDVGCSTGFMTFRYSQVFKQVIGIDIDDFDGNPLLSEHHPHAVTLRTGCIGKQRHHRTAIGDYSHDFLH